MERCATSLGGAKSSLSHLHSHCAHVGDLFSGRRHKEREVHTRVIAVSLPRNASWITSGFRSDMYVIDAMHYILRRADNLHRAYQKLHGTRQVPPTRLVVNLSYGLSAGPHDGTLPIDAAMAEMIAHRCTYVPTVLVMQSGNHFTDSLHVVLLQDHFENKGKAKTAELKLMLQPDDRTSSFVELWLPSKLRHEKLALELVPPLFTR